MNHLCTLRITSKREVPKVDGHGTTATKDKRKALHFTSNLTWPLHLTQRETSKQGHFSSWLQNGYCSRESYSSFKDDSAYEHVHTGAAQQVHECAYTTRARFSLRSTLAACLCPSAYRMAVLVLACPGLACAGKVMTTVWRVSTRPTRSSQCWSRVRKCSYTSWSTGASRLFRLILSPSWRRTFCRGSRWCLCVPDVMRNLTFAVVVLATRVLSAPVAS